MVSWSPYINELLIKFVIGFKVPLQWLNIVCSFKAVKAVTSHFPVRILWLPDRSMANVSWNSSLQSISCSCQCFLAETEPSFSLGQCKRSPVTLQYGSFVRQIEGPNWITFLKTAVCSQSGAEPSGHNTKGFPFTHWNSVKWNLSHFFHSAQRWTGQKKIVPRPLPHDPLSFF